VLLIRKLATMFMSIINTIVYQVAEALILLSTCRFESVLPSNVDLEPNRR